MANGTTIRDQFHAGPPPGVDELARIWNKDLVDRLLEITWQAYDQLHQDFLSKIPWDKSYDDLERSITRELEQAIHDQMDDFLPVRVQHGPPEHASKSPPPAQPPEYDIAFVWRGDSRIMWPLEAKVIKNDRDTLDNLKDYVQTVQERYLTCKYAPFSDAGAMIAYLKQGNPLNVLAYIAVRLGVMMSSYEILSGRPHQVSDHVRQAPRDKSYPSTFRCHHLVFLLGNVEI